MKRFRSLFLLFLMILLVFTLASCRLIKDEDGNEGGEVDYEQNATEVTLSFELNADRKSYSVARSYTELYTGNIVIPKRYAGLPVTAIGNQAFYDCTSVKSVIIPEGIKSIGSNAFYGCSGISEIVIPDSVTEIGDNAFFECTALSKVELSEGLTVIGAAAFGRCCSLTEIIIPDSVTELGAAVFKDCTVLENVVIGKNITEMKASDDQYNGDGTFANCTSLKHIELPEGISYIPAFAFSGCTSLQEIMIPEGVTEIQKYAFSYCSSLTSVTVPKKVSKIGKCAFDSCASLFEICNQSALKLNAEDFSSVKNIITDSADSKIRNIDGFVFYEDGEDILLIKYIGEETKVTLPEYEDGRKYSVKPRIFTSTPKITELTVPDCISSIDALAFYDCTAVEALTLNCSDAEIDIWYFEGNESVKTVYVNADNSFHLSFLRNIETAIYGEGVSYIEENAFSESGINRVVISSTVTEIRASAFKNSDVSELAFAEGSRLEDIGAYAFSGCADLKTPVFPDGLKTIGEGAFAGAGVNSIGLGSCLTSIGDKAFENSAIKSIFFPDSLKSIGKGAFANCLYLSKAEIGEESQLEAIGEEAFFLCQKLHAIYLPKNLSYLGSYAFVSSSLRVINLAEDNPYFEKIDDNLYSEDKTVFVLCPRKQLTPGILIPYFVKEIAPGAFRGIDYITEVVFEEGSQLEVIGEMAFYGSSATEITVPAGVKMIGKAAFGYCQSLKSVTFADGIRLTELSDGVFSDCYSLSSITVPADVLKIGEKAFFYSGIVNIYYDGSLDMWNEIEKGQSWDSGMGNYLNNYTVHCSDGIIEKK
ncbi:MAG: leucine-rich repeat domain-containing protein [Clostridia bacterium]|nr:leucine-rich repeat domain-containing protein [Clostridia bacterium]